MKMKHLFELLYAFSMPQFFFFPEVKNIFHSSFFGSLPGKLERYLPFNVIMANKT